MLSLQGIFRVMKNGLTRSSDWVKLNFRFVLFISLHFLRGVNFFSQQMSVREALTKKNVEGLGQ